eukprot:Sspe_Gene.114188::Locus_99680_Transcript_1_1_Confidence_1.000_Length_714::g.114188::m.114188
MGGSSGVVKSSPGVAAGRPSRLTTTIHVVLDFDLTISVMHVWNYLCRTGAVTPARVKELDAVKVFGRPERQQHLHRSFSSLREMGAELIILTNNHAAVVSECLKMGQYEKYFSRVIGRDRPGTKGKIVSQLQRECPGPSFWLFIDDDSSNIESVKVEATEVYTVHVESGKGMSVDHLEAILEFVRKHKAA